MHQLQGNAADAEQREKLLADEAMVFGAYPIALGEHGTGDPEQWPPHRLAPVRHSELRNALAHIAVGRANPRLHQV